jgi:cysteine synthase A
LARWLSPEPRDPASRDASGNTGIGLAMVCAQKVYPLVVTMAETFSVERRKLMRFLGTKVVITPAVERGMWMVKKKPSSLPRRTAVSYAVVTRQFENEANAGMHSRTTSREILPDFCGRAFD